MCLKGVHKRENDNEKSVEQSTNAILNPSASSVKNPLRDIPNGICKEIIYALFIFVRFNHFIEDFILFCRYTINVFVRRFVKVQ